MPLQIRKQTINKQGVVPIWKLRSRKKKGRWFQRRQEDGCTEIDKEILKRNQKENQHRIKRKFEMWDRVKEWLRLHEKHMPSLLKQDKICHWAPDPAKPPIQKKILRNLVRQEGLGQFTPRLQWKLDKEVDEVEQEKVVQEILRRESKVPTTRTWSRE